MFNAALYPEMEKELGKLHFQFLITKKPNSEGEVVGILEVINNSKLTISLRVEFVCEDHGIISFETLGEPRPVYDLKPNSRTRLRSDTGSKFGIRRKNVMFLNQGYGTFTAFISLRTEYGEDQFSYPIMNIFRKG